MKEKKKDFYTVKISLVLVVQSCCANVLKFSPWDFFESFYFFINFNNYKPGLCMLYFALHTYIFIYKYIFLCTFNRIWHMPLFRTTYIYHIIIQLSSSGLRFLLKGPAVAAARL